MTRIFIVDDEMHILLLIQRILESAGYEVRTTTTGLDALQIALDYKPHLVLLDIMLPGKNGLDICRELKSTLGKEAPPVILMSARGNQIDVAAGRAAGANNYIIKPFPPRQLIDLIEEELY